MERLGFMGGDISNSGTTSPSQGIAITDNQIVAVGNSGTIWNKIGDNDWTQIAGVTSGDPPSDVAFGLVNHTDPRYVITHQTLHEESPGGIFVSRSSIDWQTRLADNQDLRAVTFGNNRFVAVGKQNHSTSSNQIVYTSNDGAQSFEPHVLEPTNALLDVTFGNETFVAVGYGGVIFTSNVAGENWSDWVLRTSGTSKLLTGVAFGNNQFVVVGESTNILSSQDGISWSPVADISDYSLNSIAYGNEIFVAVGENLILTLETGATWEEQVLPDRLIPTNVKFLEDRFLILGMESQLFSSMDGISWTAHDSQTVNNLNSITFDGLSYLLVGDNPWDRTPFVLQSAVENYPFGISDISKRENGDVALILQARPGSSIEIRDTSDFENWNTLGTIIGEGLFTQFIDRSATGIPRRFYQGITQE